MSSAISASLAGLGTANADGHTQIEAEQMSTVVKKKLSAITELCVLHGHAPCGSRANRHETLTWMEVTAKMLPAKM
jgi:hypothetical protein